MKEADLEKWEYLRYRMDEEGFEYCFKHYSSFDEIKDDEFHKLRLEVISKMDEMRNLVKNRINELSENYLD